MPENTFDFSYNHALVDPGRLVETAAGLSDYAEALRAVVQLGGYGSHESSINLASDPEIYKRVAAMVKAKATPELTYIIVVGIGGSFQGTKAIYDALFGTLDAFSDRYPKVLFVDTVSSKQVNAVLELLSGLEEASQVLINVISKSGTTTEVIANFEVLYGRLSSHLPGLEDRVVVTTDEGSKLWEAATAKGISTLAVPELVGGRFSVLSAVGLFPLMLSGVDCKALLDGAAGMRDLCVSSNVEENPAMASACLTHLHHEDGVKLNNTFFFNPDMIAVGMWYRQLMGESIGKERNLDGKVVHTGITPFVTIGSTDLHSLAQLFFGGPNDKFTTFVYSREDIAEMLILVGKRMFPDLVPAIEGKTLADVMDAIHQGTTAAYGKIGIPFAEFRLSEVSARTLGQFLQFKMIEMMFLAKLLNLNAFDQPNVEAYKAETRAILEA